jgi:ABC-2 type transport system ATP-binding protein
MSEQNIAVKVENLTKSFHIPLEASSGIKQKIINLLKGKKGYRDFTPLKNVSFEINEGDFFGIVGRNGSGKSTLLKTLAGIYTPDSGAVTVNGKLVPFIELGVGFNPELSGKENVYLNGALLGFSHKEMEHMYEDIVDFAELHEFMEEKLKNYSSGMQVRLAFSIAIRAKGDILLLDEILAVGDEAFQRKCYSYFAQLKKDKKTVILVTHSMEAVQQFCNRAVLIDKEHKLVVGSPLQVAQIYRELNEESGVTVNVIDNENLNGTRFVDLISEVQEDSEIIRLKLEVTPKLKLEDPVVTVEIFAENGDYIIRWVSDEQLKETVILEPNTTSKFLIELQNIFPVGRYYVRAGVKRKDRTVNYGIFNESSTFVVSNNSQYEHDVFWKPSTTSSVKVIS